MGLLAEKLMMIEIYNRGAVDLANNWSTKRRKKRIQTRVFFLRDLKEEGILKIVWKKAVNNNVDMFTNNLAGQHYNECYKDFVGDNDNNNE